MKRIEVTYVTCHKTECYRRLAFLLVLLPQSAVPASDMQQSFQWRHRQQQFIPSVPYNFICIVHCKFLHVFPENNLLSTPHKKHFGQEDKNSLLGLKYNYVQHHYVMYIGSEITEAFSVSLNSDTFFLHIQCLAHMLKIREYVYILFAACSYCRHRPCERKKISFSLASKSFWSLHSIFITCCHFCHRKGYWLCL